MVSLFRRPRGGELELLRSAVSQLGEKSVDGLATALGWRRRATERCLAEELARPATPLAYDARTGTVRWGALAGPVAEPDATPYAAAPSASELARPFGEPRPSNLAAAPVEAALPPIRGSCPSCHVALHPATNGAFAVCPRCGKLTSRRTLEATQGPPAGAAERPANEGTPPALGDDRRHQEMLAAYVTSRPILCPRCHAPLRHRSLAEYVCPGCGREVRFPSNQGAETAASPPAVAARALPEESAAPKATPPRAGAGRRGSRAHAGTEPAGASPTARSAGPGPVGTSSRAAHNAVRAGRARGAPDDDVRGRPTCRTGSRLRR
jgi:predicted RNA-binding Zn-ribbon protein involved in translation (DUF1610 family)